MIDFTLFTADSFGDSANCLYANKVHITDMASFKQAIKLDHVCAAYKNNYRSNDNFLETDVLPMDCDNGHSDEPKDWVYPLDVAMAFPECPFLVSYSRNNMKVKGGKSARPRFHVYFPIARMTDGKAYAELKRKVQQVFPYFDAEALGESRFLYGTKAPDAEYYDGNGDLVEFLTRDDFADFDALTEEIQEGSRNSTMSHIAGKIIKRFGATDEAHNLFLKAAEKCNPPLSDEELARIWRSASKFGVKVSGQEGYIAPEIYNSDCTLRPEDFSDLGQAVVMAEAYKNKLCYTPSTDFLVYNGGFWEESAPMAQRVSQELTDRQLEEAEKEIDRQTDEMKKNGAMAIIQAVGEKKAVAAFNRAQVRSYELLLNAQNYKKYAIKRRDTRQIAAALKEVRPLVNIDLGKLDANEFLLNCPSGTYDLRKGVSGVKELDPEDYITKQTAVDPSQEGEVLWQDALKLFFQEDNELIEYVQKIVGLAAIGKVYVEALIIAYGEGRNGKSTFWNAISRVLGTYSGNISADMLTVSCRRNVKPELAEAKGKRILIAAELQEGMRLNTSNVKQLCSTDEIAAEKKYKAPFAYTPTHTLVLYTNHLPKVSALDKGTWRRLIIIPFGANIEGASDIKNYGDYLFKNAGGAILKWIIDGAEKIISERFSITLPEKVKAAIDGYRSNNDWMGAFIDERCEVDPSYEAPSGEFYNEYRAYCIQTGEYVRSSVDFYSSLEAYGFTRHRKKKGRFIIGIRLKPEFN